MIIKAGPELRGQRLSGLVWYLYSPGSAREHENPRLVAAWADVGDVGPALTPRGRCDLRPMLARMQVPLKSLHPERRPVKPVWHCIVRNHADDPHLSDEQWAAIAKEVVAAVGLEDTRWVAVRHDDHGVHLAAVLVTESGHVPRLSWEKNRLDQLRRRLEPRYCTVRTGTSRTGDRRPTRGEHEKARRQHRAEPARATLRRAVNVAAIAAGSDDEFLDHLRRAGVMVGLRHSTKDPDQITGYKVALPGHHTGDGQPIWYSGRCLGAEMTWPKIRTRWAGPQPAADSTALDAPAPSPGGTAAAATADAQVWQRPRLQSDTYRSARWAMREVSSMLRTDPQLAGELQSAVADIGAALGYAWDGPHDGRRTRAVTSALDVADRAGRTPNRGAHRYHLRTAQNLRSTARAIALAGRVAHGDDEAAWMLVVHQLVATLEALGDAQRAVQRVDQAAAAHRSATALRTEIETLRPQVAASAPTAVQTLPRRQDEPQRRPGR